MTVATLAQFAGSSASGSRCGARRAAPPAAWAHCWEALQAGRGREQEAGSPAPAAGKPGQTLSASGCCLREQDLCREREGRTLKQEGLILAPLFI